MIACHWVRPEDGCILFAHRMFTKQAKHTYLMSGMLYLLHFPMPCGPSMQICITDVSVVSTGNAYDWCSLLAAENELIGTGRGDLAKVRMSRTDRVQVPMQVRGQMLVL